MPEGKAPVKDTDMPARMQAAATAAASHALDLLDVDDCRAIAGHLKTEFDRRYGMGWQCMVGASFGCFFTYSSGTFIYFSLERLTFMCSGSVARQIFRLAGPVTGAREAVWWCCSSGSWSRMWWCEVASGESP